MTRRFDAIIIGAGQAGPALAGRLAGAGKTVALIERHLFGGTCVNTGCMPTKTLVASARAAHVARRAAEFGVLRHDAVGIDMRVVKARKDTVVRRCEQPASRHIAARLPGCTVFKGHARFASAREVRVGNDLLTADRIFVNAGGRALIPDMPGREQVRYLTNTLLLELDRVPRHLVVVGGSDGGPGVRADVPAVWRRR